MTIVELPMFPPADGSGAYDFTGTYTLSGAQYQLRFMWQSRMVAWYVSLYTSDGTALIEGCRVSPGFAPWAGFQVEGRPPGELVIVGPDPYAANDLGTTVFVTYVDDIPVPDDNPYGLRVVVS